MSDERFCAEWIAAGSSRVHSHAVDLFIREAHASGGIADEEENISLLLIEKSTRSTRAAGRIGDSNSRACPRYPEVGRSFFLAFLIERITR